MGAFGWAAALANIRCMDLSVTESSDGPDVRVLAAAGSIDLQSRTSLVDAGRRQLDQNNIRRLVLDLAGVTFIDSSGIGAVIELAGIATDQDCAFALRNPSARVQRVLGITGLQDAWEIESN